MSEVSAWFREKISRRGLLWGGLAAAGGSAIAGTAAGQSVHSGHGTAALAGIEPPPAHLAAHGSMITVGDVDNERNGFDPSRMVTDWETGSVSTLPDGRILRTFEIEAIDKKIEIAPGIMFAAWTYNGRVPGPALRATEGDRASDRLQEFRFTSALDALPRHPCCTDRRRSGGGPDRCWPTRSDTSATALRLWRA